MLWTRGAFLWDVEDMRRRRGLASRLGPSGGRLEGRLRGRWCSRHDGWLCERISERTRFPEFWSWSGSSRNRASGRFLAERLLWVAIFLFAGRGLRIQVRI